MTKRKPRQTGQRAQDAPDLHREIGGLLLVALGGVCTLALFSATKGVLSDLAAGSLLQAFGWGAYVVSLGVLAGGLLLLSLNLGTRFSPPAPRIIGFSILLVVALGLSHLIAAPQAEGLALARSGGGGGYVGWLVSSALTVPLGRVPAFAVLIVAALVSIALALQVSPDVFRELWGQLSGQVQEWVKGFSAAREPREARSAPTRSVPETPVQRQPLPSQPKAKAKRSLPPEFQIQMAQARSRKVRRRKSLPPLDLIEAQTEQALDEETLRHQAHIIEETLASFGVPASVVECRHGPTVTQFGVEPGYIERQSRTGELLQAKVRVNKITSLVNDLALALAASPIRIEAPVPGRAIVGIEVPNPRPSIVSLRGVMEEPEFTKARAPLKIALGRDVAGSAIVADLGKMPHLLIAGATGSGKSACINALISCLLFNNTPDRLRLVLIDPKRVEMVPYNGIPHLLGRVLQETEQVIAAIKWLTREMERRYHILSAAKARNLQAYNRKASSLGEEQLPHIVVFIDELAELMMVSPDEVERHICRIAQMARATGIHLVLATQRPSVDVVTGLIKANFPARACFATTSQIDSRVVLDAPGAEKLLGRGDMLFMPPDSSKLVRAQGCWVSDPEINALCEFWRDKATAYLSLLDEPVPWEQDLQENEADDLLLQAVQLIQEHQQASASFLQRRLRVGYPRAARLIDELEEQGYIGPAVSGGRTRQVLAGGDDDAN